MAKKTVRIQEISFSCAKARLVMRCVQGLHISHRSFQKETPYILYHQRLLFFISVDSRRTVLCVRSCACAGQCLLLFSPFSSAHVATAAAEHTRNELLVIVSSCTYNDTNFIFPAFNSDSAAVDSRLLRNFGLLSGDVVGGKYYTIIYEQWWSDTLENSYHHRMRR